MVWFAPRIDDQAASTAPMFVVDERGDALNVTGRVAPREGNPQPIRQGLCGKSAVVDDNDQWNLTDRRFLCEVRRNGRCLDRSSHFLWLLAPAQRRHRADTGAVR